MNITQELVTEHQLILRINHQIHELTSEPFNISSEKYFLMIEKYVVFIENFIDDYHHNKEEEFLFEALGLPGVLAPQLLINQILEEHQQAKNVLKQIKHGVKFKDYNEIALGIYNYTQLMSQHISKKDYVLYPLAEAYLNDSVKQRINQFYNDVHLCQKRESLWDTYVEFSEELTMVLLRKNNRVH